MSVELTKVRALNCRGSRVIVVSRTIFWAVVRKAVR
jgi:hypothetical protein